MADWQHPSYMPRATFLIVEVEPPEGISARKLVLETAKHNVITAYSAHEGLELFHRFPAIDPPSFRRAVEAVTSARD